MHRVQGLGCRWIGEGSQSDAGAPKKIRRQPGAGVVYSGRRTGRGSQARRCDHGRSSCGDGHVTRIRGPTEFYKVTDSSQLAAEQPGTTGATVVPISAARPSPKEESD